jgi:hypothetical protein
MGRCLENCHSFQRFLYRLRRLVGKKDFLASDLLDTGQILRDLSE